MFDIFDDKAINEVPKIKQSEFNHRVINVLENIAKRYYESWHTRPLKDEEFPEESVCDKCTGCGTFVNREFRSDCFQDREEGWCYYRYQDAEEFGKEVEVELENIYGLLNIEIVSDNSDISEITTP